MCEEAWKRVRNYPDYEVSNLGRARSLKFGWKRILRSKRLRSRYCTINLHKNGSIRQIDLHVLIAEAFLGQRPNNYVCNHKDGDKWNNNVSNLEWMSKSDDINHAYRLGLIEAQIGFGEKHPRAKLKNDEVWLIEKLLFYKITQVKIAKMFKVSRGCISHISAKNTWRHVKYIGEV